jgi:uncharacterized protein
MRIVYFTLLSVIISMSSCKENNEQLGDDCLVKLPNVTFTKSLNNAAGLYSLENARLTMRSEAKKDYFNDPDGKLSNNTAPVLLSKVDNKKPFTLTAKVTPSFKETYDAGVLYIFSTDKLWQKFAFERDERGRTRIVSVRTIETSDDNNHDIITNESVFLKLTSDTKTVGLYYSIDNVTWNLARLYKNNYPDVIWVGLSTQSPIGNGTTAIFENCALSDTSIKNFREGV